MKCIWYSPQKMQISCIYFIPSSEFNAYLKQIKVILSAMKKYRIFSLVTNTIYIFFTAADRGCFDNWGIHFFPKKSGMHRFCLTLRYGRKHVKQSNWRQTLTSLLSSRYANLHPTSVRRQLQAAILNHKFLFIHSLKWHLKPFFRCKLCLHPILYPLNTLSQAKLTRILIWR